MSKRDSHAPGGGTRQAEEGFVHVQEPPKLCSVGWNLDSCRETGTRPASQPSVSRAVILDLVSSCPRHPLEFSRNEGKVHSSKRTRFQSREGCRQPLGAVVLRRSRCEYPGRPGAGQAHGSTPWQLSPSCYPHGCVVWPQLLSSQGLLQVKTAKSKLTLL